MKFFTRGAAAGRSRAARPRSSESASIAVDQVSFWYDTSLVLSDISFTIDQGEFVSIIGPSGCGKSTLLQLLDGALRTSTGSVIVEGEPPGNSVGERAMVFQHFGLLPWKTVLGNVMLGLGYRRKDLPTRERERIAKQYIAQVGLAGAEHRYPYQLSGGMQQRVGLARALAVRPRVLLMDEPFAALDAQTAELMREDLRALVAQEARTVVLVTHNLDEALQLSDRILLMDSGPGRIAERLDVRGLRSPAGVDQAAYASHRERLWDHLKRGVGNGNLRQSAG